MILFIAIIISILSIDNACFAQRQIVSLNGIWDFKWDNENYLVYPPDSSAWDKIKVGIISEYVTGFGKNGTNHRAWYRRTVKVPVSMKGNQIKIRFSSVKFRADVYWNGEKIGTHLDGYIPFEIDITNKVKFEGENELLVGVTDRIAIQRSDVLPYTVMEQGAEGDGVLGPPDATILNAVYRTSRPIGGIVDKVELVSYPFVYIEDFHITTSVRKSYCMVEVTTLNNSSKSGSYETDVVIKDKGKIVKKFPKQSVYLAAGENKKKLFKLAWDNAHLWSPEEPYLYDMELRLYEGDKVIDETTFKMGFREYWIEGTEFYLNGKVFKIRRNHFNFGDSYEDGLKYMQMLKDMNVSQIRLHHRAAPEWILDYADEIGMTLVTESAFFSRTIWYDIDNPYMWENAKKHWAGIIKSAKNHPSVIMYSVENEMLSTGSYMAETDPDKWQRYINNWIEVGKHIKNLDPTKPLQYSWGQDVGGWAETINMHYQRHIRSFFQYPNDLYWLENENLTERKGFGIGGDWNHNYNWKRDKPYIMGEFGYQYHANPPHGLTSFIGDKAYVSNNWYKTWYWALEQKYKAYKYSGISANPWVFTSDRDVLFPLEEVFLKDWRSNFYSGEELRKEIIVLNESYQSKKLDLEINFSDEDEIYYEEKITLNLKEGEKWINELNFSLPKVSKRLNATLTMKLVKNSKELDKYSIPIHIFPQRGTVDYVTGEIGLYDPHGKTLRELTLSGFVFTKLDVINKETLSKLKVLVIGKDALTLDFDKKEEISEFVKRGGSTIILEQTLIPNHSWPFFRLEIDKEHSSTIAFKSAADHPILKGIEEDDLKYWRGNHQVSQFNFVRPKFWNYTTVSHVGSGMGINHTPLLTFPYGEGILIFSQFVLSKEMANEPAAFILFNNMLEYSLEYKSSYKKAGMYVGKESFLPKAIKYFGAKVEHLENFPPKDIGTYDVLFFDGAIDLKEHHSDLEKFLACGGKIVLRELTPETIKNVKNLIPGNILLKPLPKRITFDSSLVDLKDLTISFSPSRDERVATTWYPLHWENEREMREFVTPIRAHKVGAHSLMDGITNTDLYWRTSSKSLYNTFGEEAAPISSYVIEGDQVVPFTSPAVIGSIEYKKGKVIIDEIDWQTGSQKLPNRTSRIISNLLNNLGIKMKPYNIR